MLKNVKTGFFTYNFVPFLGPAMPGILSVTCNMLFGLHQIELKSYQLFELFLLSFHFHCIRFWLQLVMTAIPPVAGS
jgi:hypothetical protein